jgi:methionine sulfoxide reductase heme-binding subunit
LGFKQGSKGNQVTLWPTWLGFLTGLAALALGLLTGADLQESWQLAARYTARASFPFFIITFAASSLQQLYRRPWTRTLLRNRRWWGLGFAACFVTHLVALLTYNWLKGSFPPVGPLDPGVWVYAVLLGMVLTSTDAARRRLGRWWKVLHRTGMWGLFFIFVLSPYVFALLDGKLPDFEPLNEPYTIPGFAALGLKIVAWWQRRTKRLRPVTET